MPISNYLTVKEIADLLKLNILTIYEYIRKNQLIAIRIGKHYRIDQQDLVNFIEERRTIKR